MPAKADPATGPAPDSPSVVALDRTRISPFAIATAIAGLLLFAWALRQAGFATITDGVRRVGAGFLLIVGLAGLRFLARAQAWALATEGPTPLRLRDTFPALVAADTLGNLTPLGLFLSEPLKAAFVRGRVTLMAAIAGIAVENLLYICSVATIIGAGTVALLFLFDIADAVRTLALGTLSAIAAGAIAGAVILWRRVKILTGPLTWLADRGRGPTPLVGRLEKLRALENLVYSFAVREPRRAAAVLALEAAFHVAGILEVWLTLGLLAGPAAPTLLSTFVLESVNRTIMVVFKFVPLRLGVDEVATELLTRTLGLAPGLGVTMALVRKARMIAWSLVGVGILARRGIRPASLRGTPPRRATVGGPE